MHFAFKTTKEEAYGTKKKFGGSAMKRSSYIRIFICSLLLRERGEAIQFFIWSSIQNLSCACDGSYRGYTYIIVPILFIVRGRPSF